MKSTRAARILVAIVLVIAVLGAIWYVKRQPPNSAPSVPGSMTDNPSGLKAYRDAKGRFTFSYPADMARIEAQQPYYGLSHVEVALMTDQASYHPMNYSQDSWLVVSSDAVPEVACFRPVLDGQVAFRDQKTINGVAFKVATTNDAGAGNRYESNLYRTHHDGTCYEIATTLHYASDFNDLDEAAMNRSQDEARAALLKAAESFRFLP